MNIIGLKCVLTWVLTLAYVGMAYVYYAQEAINLSVAMLLFSVAMLFLFL